MYKYLANPHKHKKKITQLDEPFYISLRNEYGSINKKDYYKLKEKIDDIIIEYFCKNIIDEIIDNII